MNQHSIHGQKPGKPIAGAFNKLCGELLSNAHHMTLHAGHVWHPPTDVYECEKFFVIKMAISGLKKNAQGDLLDAEVLVEGDTVIIRGKRRDTCTQPKCNVYQMEIHYGYFETQVHISIPFNHDAVHAEYREGFLDVIVPKAECRPIATRKIGIAGQPGGNE